MFDVPSGVFVLVIGLSVIGAVIGLLAAGLSGKEKTDDNQDG